MPEIMRKDPKTKISKERRASPRGTELRNYRVEIKLIGEPIYQFRVTDVSIAGAGLLVKEDSNFLNLVEVGQNLDADFISPTGKMPSGLYKTEIKHISKPGKGERRGHRLVGLSIIGKIDQGKY
jgi:hypothetical protein